MEKKKEIIEGLKKAYWAEIETTINYLANSINLDGVKAEEVKETLAQEVQDEIGHARSLAKRIKELGGMTPGSYAFKARQESLQPPTESTNLKSVIEGVVEAETEAIEHYNYMVKLCDGVDYVTQDLCVRLMADEEEHLTVFKGFLKEINLNS
jgi:bacterioferritin